MQMDHPLREEREPFLFSGHGDSHGNPRPPRFPAPPRDIVDRLALDYMTYVKIAVPRSLGYASVRLKATTLISVANLY